ncbi:MULTISPECIES: flagellar motor switch protein FliG [unclassified Pseudodesulfovibrio]|uniref:flagellar motor switch protein FliG n=1 Tax=unclassified Pseudodesulfovibrio TaxID=2661612 RepID=UPI000FEB9D56|nr:MULTISPECIES: flagellar motor switch protein FliG [unclassified Pseudodesulfovibrio]MCJ2165920.1 flagellar motor switch protein FliG [Pseudodesulfovibrio sp. S3-i]RWU02649.1 flagellar motor switch protein FliG [Pseudodesulfovibrio sp. S3]
MADFSGPQKTAIVLLALGEKFTGEVFKRMERNEIAAVSKAMLDTDSVPKEEVLQVLKEYNEALTYGADLLVGGPEQVKRMLIQSLDAETAKYIMDSLDIDTGPTPFQELQNVSPRILAQILRNEHPQTLALILGHLHPDQAAELIQNLPAGVRAEVLMRLAKLEAVAEEMLMEVDKVLQSQLIAMGGKEGKKVGGVNAVAEILNAVDRNTEEEVLSEIEEESTQMAEDIRNLMFVFEDVKGVDDIAIRELLKEVSNEDLTVALKGASEDLRDKFFKNLSERASAMIKEDLEIMPPKKLSEVEAAQQSIVKTVRRLEDEGKIVISRGGSDVFV